MSVGAARSIRFGVVLFAIACGFVAGRMGGDDSAEEPAPLEGIARRDLPPAPIVRAETVEVSLPAQPGPLPTETVEGAEFLAPDGEFDGDALSLLSRASRLRGEYRDEERHGQWVARYPDGSVHREGLYEAGKKIGVWTTYYPDGAEQCVEQFEDGRRHGVCRDFWPGGELHFEVRYEAGDPVDGAYLRWHANGKKKLEGAYRGGRKQGLWTEWHEDGRRAKEMLFESGTATGIWSEWWPSGRLKSRVDHRDGGDGRTLGKWEEDGDPEQVHPE